MRGGTALMDGRMCDSKEPQALLAHPHEGRYNGTAPLILNRVNIYRKA